MRWVGRVGVGDGVDFFVGVHVAGALGVALAGL